VITQVINFRLNPIRLMIQFIGGLVA